MEVEIDLEEFNKLTADEVMEFINDADQTVIGINRLIEGAEKRYHELRKKDRDFFYYLRSGRFPD